MATRRLLVAACLAAPQLGAWGLRLGALVRLENLAYADSSVRLAIARVTVAASAAKAPDETPVLSRPRPRRGRGGRGGRGARPVIDRTGQAAGQGRGGAVSTEQVARKSALRSVCAAVRSGSWDEVNASLSGDGMRWGRGEWRAMVQAASQVSDWRGATWLLDAMAERGLAADAPAYGHTLVACARAGELDAPMRLLEELAEANVAPELRPMNQLIAAAGKAGRWKLSLYILKKMPALGVAPSTISYNSALSALARAGRWEEAVELLASMTAEHAPPDVISYTTTVAACQKGGAATQALEVLRQMNESSTTAVAPNAVTFTAAVTALADAGRWREALRTYDAMPPEVERSEAVLHAAVVAAARGGQWRRAARMMGVDPGGRGEAAAEGGEVTLGTAGGAGRGAAAADQGERDGGDGWPAVGEADTGDEGIRVSDGATGRDGRGAAAWPAVVPRAASFNVAIRSCADAGQPATAMALLRRMQRLDVPRSLLSFNAALGALASAGDAGTAVRVLDWMEAEGVAPTLVSFNHALSACAQSAQGEEGMAVLGRLRAAGLTPDVISYTSAISAFSRAGDVPPVLGLIGAMEEGDEAEPNGWTWAATIAACERGGQWQQALALFAGLREAGGAASEAVWNAAISAAGAGAQFDIAVRLLEEMRSAGFQPGLRATNAALKAAAAAGEGDAALTLLSRMRPELAPDAISYTLVVNALGRCGMWEAALGVWGAMLDAGIEPDAPALSTLLRALTAANQTDTALGIFDAAHGAGWRIARTSQAVSAAIDAAAAQADARRAVALLGALKTERGPAAASAGCYRGAIEACAAADEWRAALGLWEEMVRVAVSSSLVPDARAHRAAFRACRAAGEEEAASRVARLAEEQGLPLVALQEDEDDH